MMAVLRAGLGADRIVGEQFPLVAWRKKIEAKQELETDIEHSLRVRAWAQTNRAARRDIDEHIAMNPGGYWESEYTMHGFRYLPGLDAEQHESLCLQVIAPHVVKIVAMALLKTEARHVERLLYMNRHPAAVARSQEKLLRYAEFTKKDGTTLEVFKDIVYRSPQLYIASAIAFANYIHKHRQSFLIKSYENLIENTPAVFSSLASFFPGFDGTKATGIIRQDLNRSKTDYPLPDERIWREAVQIYRWLQSSDLDAIYEYAGERDTEFARLTRGWICPRKEAYVVAANCEGCMTNPQEVKTGIAYAESKQIPWRSRHCSFECGYRLDAPPISVEKSIAENHWLKHA
jgi:hypothetical protein